MEGRAVKIKPETTLAEIAADEQMQRELIEVILANGPRGAMARRKVSYDSADAIAEGIAAGVRNGLGYLVEGVIE